MRLEVKPTGLASKDSKKKWLVHEILRYRDFIRGTHTIKILVSGLIAMMTYRLIEGWTGILVMVLAVGAFDFLFEFWLFSRMKDFYIDLAEACFDGEASSDHDFRILMNRVENFIKSKDTDRKDDLYKALEDCYMDMSIKTSIKEGVEEIKKILKG